MLDITYGAAFLAGLLSFISPCVLPLVPPYLAYITGVSFSELTSDELEKGASKRIFLAALLFVLGFSLVFISLGATATFIGQAVAQYYDWLRYLAGGIIMVMGLHFLGILRLNIFYRQARFSPSQKGQARLAGAFVMGLAFAFGWSPCVGPILASILFVAGSEDTITRGAILLGAYSLGIGLPFLLAAMFASPFVKWMTRFKQHIRWVEKIMGGFLVLIGLFFIFGFMPYIAQFMLDNFPSFATIG